MDWKKFWNDKGMAGSRHEQVGRINTSNPNTLSQLAQRIKELLDLNKTDEVLDVCCGNGMLSLEVSQYCKSLTGIDFSDVLLSRAKAQQHHGNLEFVEGRAEDFSLPYTFDKGYLAFSFQYFEKYHTGKQVIENCCRHIHKGGFFLLTDIPDHDKRKVFYNTPLKRFYYIKQKLLSNESMGKFWSEAELRNICKELALKGTRIQQPADLPYSHYRFDWLIEV